MKGIHELYEPLMNICSGHDVIQDKIREVFARFRCAALTVKGGPCSFAPKTNGFCGRHMKHAKVQCTYTRSDHSRCSLNALPKAPHCWLHRGATVDVAGAPPSAPPEPAITLTPPPVVESPRIVPHEMEAPLPTHIVATQRCPVLLKTGQPCEAMLKTPSAMTCSKHKVQQLPRIEGTATLQCNVLETMCGPQAWMRGQVYQTQGYEEHELAGDKDDVIDESNALPSFRPKHCIYFCETLHRLCAEPVAHHHMCKDHVKFRRQHPHNKGTNRYFDPYWMVQRPYLERATLIAPNYHWFPHLNFYAHMTLHGPIVVGKVWSMIFPETLETFPVSNLVRYTKHGEETIEPERQKAWMIKFGFNNDACESETSTDLIRRCHNNGLLYKVLSQTLLHKQFDLPPDLDALEGQGFISFEQMIQQRPTLYIKYWNVWLGHIQRAKDFTRFAHVEPERLQRYLNIDSPPDWEYYMKVLGPQIGLYHVEVPAPSLEAVQDPQFNPFVYCRTWVQTHAPDRIAEPWFPPYHLLYPFPVEALEVRQYQQRRTRVEHIQDKKLFAHYEQRQGIRATLSSWMQWLKYGKHKGEFRALYAFHPIDPPIPHSLLEAGQHARDMFKRPPLLQNALRNH